MEALRSRPIPTVPMRLEANSDPPHAGHVRTLLRTAFMSEANGRLDVSKMLLWTLSILSAITVSTVGFIAKTMIALDTRVAIIESNRFTESDARTLRDRVSNIEYNTRRLDTLEMTMESRRQRIEALERQVGIIETQIRKKEDKP